MGCHGKGPALAHNGAILERPRMLDGLDPISMYMFSFLAIANKEPGNSETQNGTNHLSKLAPPALLCVYIEDTADATPTSVLPSVRASRRLVQCLSLHEACSFCMYARSVGEANLRCAEGSLCGYALIEAYHHNMYHHWIAICGCPCLKLRIASEFGSVCTVTSSCLVGSSG